MACCWAYHQAFRTFLFSMCSALRIICRLIFLGARCCTQASIIWFTQVAIPVLESTSSLLPCPRWRPTVFHSSSFYILEAEFRYVSGLATLETCFDWTFGGFVLLISRLVRHRSSSAWSRYLSGHFSRSWNIVSSDCSTAMSILVLFGKLSEFI